MVGRGPRVSLRASRRRGRAATAGQRRLELRRRHPERRASRRRWRSPLDVDSSSGRSPSSASATPDRLVGDVVDVGRIGCVSVECRRALDLAGAAGGGGAAPARRCGGGAPALLLRCRGVVDGGCAIAGAGLGRADAGAATLEPRRVAVRRTRAQAPPTATRRRTTRGQWRTMTRARPAAGRASTAPSAGPGAARIAAASARVQRGGGAGDGRGRGRVEQRGPARVADRASARAGRFEVSASTGLPRSLVMARCSSVPAFVSLTPSTRAISALESSAWYFSAISSRSRGASAASARARRRAAARRSALVLGRERARRSSGSSSSVARRLRRRSSSSAALRAIPNSQARALPRRAVEERARCGRRARTPRRSRPRRRRGRAAASRRRRTRRRGSRGTAPRSAPSARCRARRAGSRSRWPSHPVLRRAASIADDRDARAACRALLARSA